MNHKFLISLLSAAFVFCASDVFAHKVTAVSVVSKFDTKARKYSIELAMDIYPSEDQATNEEVSPEQAADFFSKEALILFFGDTQIKPKTKSELFKDPEADPEIQEVKVKVLVTLFGEIPKDAGHFTLRVSPDTTAAVVMVTFKDGKPGRRAEVLYPGEFSSPVDVSAIIEGDPFAKVGDDADKGEMQQLGKKIQEQVPDSGEDEAVSRAGSMRYFIELGMRSFFSGRYEAVLMGLCFLFFSQKLRELFFQVAMFIVAYSLALGMAVFGVASVSGMSNMSGVLLGWVIPLTIFALAVENLFAEKLRWWRLGVISISGFLMGTVYSMTLGLAGMSADSVTAAFAGFNLGFQLGLLLTLTITGFVVMAFWGRDWYRRSVVLPISLLIAGVSLYWMIEQAFFSS